MHFVLVHGTFVPGAKWTRRGSTLRSTLESLGSDDEPVAFSNIVWSGKNRLADRHEAAKQLRLHMQQVVARSPEEKFVIIGHSHGGSVVAHYLQLNRSALPTQLMGCAFLSSPFYAMRLDARALKALPVLFAFILAFVSSFIASGVGLVLYNLSMSSIMYTILGVSVVLAIVVDPIVAILGRRRLLMRFYKYISANVAERSRYIETCNLPSGNYFFAKVAGDEAAVVLQVAQVIMLMMRRGITVVSRSLLLPIALLKNRRKVISWVSRAYLLVAMPTLLVSIFGLLNYTEPDQLERVYSILPFTFPLILVLASAGFMACVIIIAMAAGAVFLRGLGWFTVIDALVGEFSIEHTAYGDHQFVQGRWDWRGKTRLGFASSHGRVYEDPFIASRLSAWAVRAFHVVQR